MRRDLVCDPWCYDDTDSCEKVCENQVPALLGMPLWPLPRLIIRLQCRTAPNCRIGEMASRGITVVGSYSPAIARATKGDFFDDVHPRPAIVRRLFREAGVIQP